MTSDKQLIRRDPRDALEKIAATEGARETLADNLPRMAHRALRGRYWVAIVLGLMTAVAGGMAGWMNGRPLYRSQGLIRLAYSTPSAMSADHDSEMPVEVFQAFLEAQQAVLGSRRIVDLAMKEDAWKSTGRGNTPQAVQQFADSLTVLHKANTDYLQVSFTDREASAAAAAVRSIISAYARLYHDENDQLQQDRLKTVRGVRDGLQNRLSELQDKLRSTVEDVGFVNADGQYDAAKDQLGKLESIRTDIKIALVLAQNQSSSPPLTLAQIGVIDPVMRGYLTQRENLEGVLAQFASRGLGEGHAQVVEARKGLDMANQRIAQYAEDYRQAHAAMTGSGAATGPGGASMLAIRSPEALIKDKAGIDAMYQEAERTAAALAGKRQQLVNLRSQAEQVTQDLNQASQRLALLQVESGVHGRLSIISAGEVPIAPFQDRRLPLAAGVGLGAGMLPAALIVLGTLVRRRYRYSDETADNMPVQAPLLGILPVLPEHLADPERSADAAQCVHQIRVMLQVGRPGGQTSVFMLSSSSPGEGKTSLTAALGLSFAATGCRTLLIDADLIGQRLTRGFDLEAGSGLGTALARGQLEGHLRKINGGGLWILPAGSGDDARANVLSTAAVARLLEEARRSFDVVLVDSGPILGSVEASVVGPLVDGVVLVIARKQQRVLVERSVRHLASIGAKLAGMVFNRAEPTDFYRSVASASMRSVGQPQTQEAAVRQPAAYAGKPLAGLGPLVEAVASLLPAGASA